MNNRKYRADLLLLAFFAAIGLIILAVVLLRSHDGAVVQVRVDGETVETFPLDQDRTYTIGGASGGTNELIIQDGEAWVEEASCPDGICVNMGKIRKNGQSIICLPNKVVVEVIDASEESQDGTGESGDASDDVDIVTGGKQ